jgi:hypothetical protein
MQYHPGCTFAKVVFHKHYQKVQTNKHVYMALRVVKYVTDKEVELY